jgi:hypothetical protein
MNVGFFQELIGLKLLRNIRKEETRQISHVGRVVGAWIEGKEVCFRLEKVKEGERSESDHNTSNVTRVVPDEVVRIPLNKIIRLCLEIGESKDGGESIKSEQTVVFYSGNPD